MVGERRVGRPRAGREKLTRGRIVEAALGVVDREGMGALSMRRLAGELGVDPMSIYHHLPGKEAVLAGVVERVYGQEMATPSGGGDWRERVRASAGALRGVTRAHPNLALYVISTPAVAAPAALRAGEGLVAALAEGGFPPRTILRAVDLVVDYANGFALGEAGGELGRPGEREGFQAFLEARPAGDYPALRSVYAGVTEREARSDFEWGLEVIIRGLEGELP